jgi:hypothetical protein
MSFQLQKYIIFNILQGECTNHLYLIMFVQIIIPRKKKCQRAQGHNNNNQCLKGVIICATLY